MISPYVYPGLQSEIQWNIISQDTKTKADNILMVVCYELKQNVSDILGPLKKRDLAEARQIVMSLIYNYTKMNNKDVGEFVGGRDHSTVTYSNKLISDLHKNNHVFRSKLDSIIYRLNYKNIYYEKH